MSDRTAAFRLERHNLLTPSDAGVVEICRDAGGVQAQVMSCAEMQVWSRAKLVRRAEIKSALNDARTLVKVISLRGTLHLVPSDEFALYAAALRDRQLNQVRNWTLRFGITAKDLDGLNRQIMDELADGPLGRAELIRRVRPHAGKKLRWWIDRAWHVTRPAMAEGLICYGPDRGQEVTFARADSWLGPKRAKLKLTAADAQRELLQRCLRLYGPATRQDFCHWTGLSVRECVPVWESLHSEMVEVTDTDGRKGSLWRDDVERWREARLKSPHIRLLPSFDVYLLGHATKDHLVPPRHYKKVYRNQGWISPVVLIDGCVAAVWALDRASRKSVVSLKPIGPLPTAVRALIDAHATRLREFLK